MKQSRTWITLLLPVARDDVQMSYTKSPQPLLRERGGD
jgi:hypothetical protein